MGTACLGQAADRARDAKDGRTLDSGHLDGRRPEAGDHMVAVGDGRILCGRSRRALIPSEVSQKDYKEAIELLKLWAKPATADDVIVFSGGATVEVPRLQVAHARPAEQEQEAGDERPATRTRWTPTSGCPACSDIPRGQRTLRCPRREANQQLAEKRKAFKVHLQQYLPTVPEQETEDADVEIFNAEDESGRATKRYGHEEQLGLMKRRRFARLAEKRRRSEEADEEQKAEEQMKRGTVYVNLTAKFEGKRAQEGLVDVEDFKHLIDPYAYMVGSVRRPPDTGPPWYDDVSGEPLEDDAVRAAMKKEMESMASFGVCKKAQENEAYNNPDAIIVGSRWVRITKADGSAKCRLVAQQINHGEKMDTYAATASSVGAHLLLAIAAERRRRRERCTLLMGDVSTAFLHALWGSRRPTFIVPPASVAEEGNFWQVLKGLYGLHESPRPFQEYVFGRRGSQSRLGTAMVRSAAVRPRAMPSCQCSLTTSCS